MEAIDGTRNRSLSRYVRDEPSHRDTHDRRTAVFFAAGPTRADPVTLYRCSTCSSVSLGAFLVIGFMLHNVTEGPAIVAPVARDERPAWWHFVALGLLAGTPVILGGWIGSLAYSPTVGAFFLAIGVGAILQVDWEIARMVRSGRSRGERHEPAGVLGWFRNHVCDGPFRGSLTSYHHYEVYITRVPHSTNVRAVRGRDRNHRCFRVSERRIGDQPDRRNGYRVYVRSRDHNDRT